jgi:hypothetical protein
MSNPFEYPPDMVIQAVVRRQISDISSTLGPYLGAALFQLQPTRMIRSFFDELPRFFPYDYALYDDDDDRYRTRVARRPEMAEFEKRSRLGRMMEQMEHFAHEADHIFHRVAERFKHYEDQFKHDREVSYFNHYNNSF